MSNQIPTAMDLLDKKYPDFENLDTGCIWSNIEETMVEFAKLHVEAALQAAAKKAELTEFAYEFLQEGASEAIDKDSILNSYSQDSIK